MITSEQTNEVGKALAEANLAIINPKNTAQNPFFKSQYAPLNEILSEVRPILAQHGLSVIQNTLSIDNNNIGIQTMILHESGQYVMSDVMCIKMDKDTAQGQGSGITYGRRYQLSAMLSISSEDDDDGNTASKSKATPPALKGEKEKGNHIYAMKKLEQCKSEVHIAEFIKLRQQKAWTDAEINEQNERIKLIRLTWVKQQEAQHE